MEGKKVTRQNVAFGRRIRKLRKGSGLTQELLADKTGLSTTFIGLLETGKRRASIKTLQRIATVLKVKVRDLINF